MAENKKSVLLYCDIIHTVSKLTNEQAGVLFKHYLQYINDLNPDAPDQLTEIVFEPIKQNLKRDLKKWESKSLKNSENANKRWNANASERIKVDANHADKDIVIVKDIVKVKDKEIPSVSEFLSHAFSKEPLVNEKSVRLKYDAWIEAGWVNGNGKKITNWKSNLNNTLPYLPKDKFKIQKEEGNTW